MSRLKKFLGKIKEVCFGWINALIPARLLIIKSRCPLRDDCKIEIKSMLVTPKLFFTDTEILDLLFKSIARHLKENHNVKEFIGLEFKSCDLKYTIYLGEVEHP